MKVLSNPWAKIPGYNCFGCSGNNHFGLKMKFIDDGASVICNWKPAPEYQGYHNILHGGIQATLMDEIASWTVFVKADNGGVTYNMEIKYKKPVYMDKGDILLKANLLNSSKRLAKVKVELFDSDGQLCSEAVADFFIVSNQNKDSVVFPGKDAFYENNNDEI